MGKREQGVVIRPELDPSSLVVTIDGPSAVGKEKLARLLSKFFGVPIVNTGQMIRSVALLAREQGLIKNGRRGLQLGRESEEQIKEWFKNPVTKPRFALKGKDRSAHVLVGEVDMTSRLRSPQDGTVFQFGLEAAASAVATTQGVRAVLYEAWTTAVKEFGGAVVIGRKTGIEPFADAHEKVVLKTNLEVAARYRFKKHAAATDSVPDEIAYLAARDGRDGANHLLEVPSGALVIDTTPYLLGNRMREVASLVKADLATKFTLRQRVKQGALRV